MADVDALTYNEFGCGDNRRLISEHRENARPSPITAFLPYIHTTSPPRHHHWNIAVRLPAALPMETHWSTYARTSANRGSVWLSEFMFGNWIGGSLCVQEARSKWFGPNISGIGISE